MCIHIYAHMYEQMVYTHTHTCVYVCMYIYMYICMPTSQNIFGIIGVLGACPQRISWPKPGDQALSRQVAATWARGVSGSRVSIPLSNPCT